ERAAGPDFGIRDERSVTRIASAHRHEYFQIQLNLAGRTEQHIGATVRPLLPGSLSFVLPYRVHHIPHPVGSRFYVISFTQRFLRPELEVDPLDLEDVPLERAPELAPFLYQEFADFRLAGTALRQARAACQRMSAEAAAQRYCWREIVRGELLLLIGLVCRAHEKTLLTLAAGRAQVRSRRAALSRALKHMRDHLTERLSLTSVAAAADLSPTYLAHLMKKETGQTFTDWLTERRMDRARELLAHTPLKIGEVAAAVGFDDEAYFTRRFRQKYGEPPGRYRTRLAQ
ncbi:MAG: AraC family transcriptional regulator, partial [Rhodospirillaceae bacterium]